MHRHQSPPFTRWTRLEDALLDQHLAVKDLAKLVDRSEVHLWQVLQGRVGVSKELLCKLADVLEIKPSELQRSRPVVPPRGASPRRATTAVPEEVAS